MYITLARKGFIEHIEVLKPENERTEDWNVKDMKADAMIAHGISIEHQSKIHGARTAREAWETLQEYYNRRNIQNRVAMTRQLHEFSTSALLQPL